MSQSASDLIMGTSGPPSVKFSNVGDKVIGQIVDLDTSQQKDYSTGELKFWKDGNPMMQTIITLQTDQRDPEIDDDDGQRRLFVASQFMKAAIKEAVLAAGAKYVAIGAKLAVQYTGDGEGKGSIPPKLYVAQYKAPDPTVAASTDLLGDDPSPF